MRFQLVDRIEEVNPGKTLKAYKNLALGEEYLADHFPTFPVMPGVLMLQCLVESAAWLLRLSEDFQHSMIVLREVKNVKYGSFMVPGRRMTMEVEQTKQEDVLTTFKGTGHNGTEQTVSARFILHSYNLQDTRPELAGVDAKLIAHYRELAQLLQ